ncbi:MAG: endonuclease III domain-containing protein, partial [Elusimicrobiota bacterium]
IRRWLAGDLAARRQELLGIFGIGPETADSILLYAGDRPAFVIDAYTLRIGKRLGWFRHSDYHRAQTYLTARLPHDHKLYNEFHALLVALAKAHCRVKPVCAGCPLAEDCRYAA